MLTWHEEFDVRMPLFLEAVTPFSQREDIRDMFMISSLKDKPNQHHNWEKNVHWYVGPMVRCGLERFCPTKAADELACVGGAIIAKGPRSKRVGKYCRRTYATFGPPDWAWRRSMCVLRYNARI